MQQSLLKTDAKLLKVEEAAKSVDDNHMEINTKLDGLYKLFQQRTPTNDFSSLEKPHQSFPNPPLLTQQQQNTLVTADEMAFLKKQEVASKILFHQDPSTSTHTLSHDSTVSPLLTFTIPNTSAFPHHGFGYTPSQSDTSPTHTPPHTNIPYQTHTKPNTIPQQQSHIPDQNTHQINTFSLSIARPKLDFPTFSSDEPVNWPRFCEKYFTLAGVPMETWVPLATLHCHGVAPTWWRSLRTPANFLH
jgi:hypothetical protein